MPSDLSTLDLATINAAQGVIVAALRDRCCQWEQDLLMPLPKDSSPMACWFSTGHSLLIYLPARSAESSLLRRGTVG